MGRKRRGSSIILTAVAGACVAVLAVATAACAAGVIRGKAIFQGSAPARHTIKMAADPVCAKANPAGRLGEAMVVDKSGGLANVFVYIREGLSSKTADPPKDPVVIDQHGCMYNPHVAGIRVGQPLEILNSDSTLHNVHALPRKSRQFNSAMPIKGMKIKKKFAAPEVMVTIKCDVHPWMRAYVGVLDHPFYAVSGKDGSFQIADVPPGTYTIEAWHERLGTRTVEVTVAEGGTTETSFKFSASK